MRGLTYQNQALRQNTVSVLHTCCNTIVYCYRPICANIVKPVWPGYMFTYVLKFNSLFWISNIPFFDFSFCNLYFTGVDEKKFGYHRIIQWNHVFTVRVDIPVKAREIQKNTKNCSNVHRYFFKNHDITGKMNTRYPLRLSLKPLCTTMSWKLGDEKPFWIIPSLAVALASRLGIFVFKSNLKKAMYSEFYNITVVPYSAHADIMVIKKTLRT